MRVADTRAMHSGRVGCLVSIGTVCGCRGGLEVVLRASCTGYRSCRKFCVPAGGAAWGSRQCTGMQYGVIACMQYGVIACVQSCTSAPSL